MSRTMQEALGRVQQKRSIESARRRFVIVFAVVLLAVLFLLFLVDRFFVIRTFEVKTESPFYSEEEIIAATGLSAGEKMFSFSEEEIRLEMLRKLSYCSDVTVKKHFPSTLTIEFEEIPGTMYVDVVGEHYILSPDFLVIARATDTDLAVRARTHLLTTEITRCVVGEAIVLENESELPLLQEIYAALDEEGLMEQVEYLDAKNRFHITLNCKGRWEVDLGDSTELDYKVRMFKKVIESAEAEHGPDTGGTIDVSGVREAIVQIYSAQTGLS